MQICFSLIHISHKFVRAHPQLSLYRCTAESLDEAPIKIPKVFLQILYVGVSMAQLLMIFCALLVFQFFSLSWSNCHASLPLFLVIHAHVSCFLPNVAASSCSRGNAAMRSSGPVTSFTGFSGSVEPYLTGKVHGYPVYAWIVPWSLPT